MRATIGWLTGVVYTEFISILILYYLICWNRLYPRLGVITAHLHLEYALPYPCPWFTPALGGKVWHVVTGYRIFPSNCGIPGRQLGIFTIGVWCLVLKCGEIYLYALACTGNLSASWLSIVGFIDAIRCDLLVNLVQLRITSLLCLNTTCVCIVCSQGVIATKCMGQSVLCGSHHKGYWEFTGEEADIVTDLRMDGVQCAILQRQRRQ